jgi:cytosine/adenosine deaminase-related metal-dependent hydrolase
MPQRDVELLITNGYVITMDEQRRVFADGAVAIAGRDIIAVGPSDELADKVSPRRKIDARGAPVHPGFIECHNHASLQLVRGAVGDTISWESVTSEFYVPYWNAVSDEEEHVATLLACCEMIRNGTTCFMEAGTVFEPSTAAEAATAVGVRALVADPFLWDVGGFTADSPDVARAPASTERCLEVLGRELARNQNPDALVRGHIALVGMGSASDELERAAKEVADANGVVLNQHQSYCSADVADDDARHGRHPLTHLADIGVLGRNCVFAHMNILRDDELSAVRATGMSLAWAPAASMLWGIGGTFRGHHLELYRSGVNVALGSDSSNWSNRFDIGQQAFLAVLTARDKMCDRTALTAEDALELATINGARAIGLSHLIGSLEPGKRADLVIRADDVPEAHPTTSPLMQLVYSARDKSVHTVVIDGRVVLEDRQPTLVDASSIYARADRAARGVLDRMGYRAPTRWPHVERSGMHV